jgi:hypothetical protein
MNKMNCENELEVNSNRKTILVMLPISTGHNFLSRGQNSEFYPPLGRLQNSLGFWYSEFSLNSFGSGCRVQICPDSLICPELTPHSTVSDHNS